MRVCFLPFLILSVAAACNSSDVVKEPVMGAGNNSDTLQSGSNTMKTEVINIQPVKIAVTDLPKDLKFKGNVQEAWQWKDKLGDNILIASYVAPYNDKQKSEYSEEGQTAELHTFHYLRKDSGYKILWKISDAEKACPFDITCGFIDGSTTITDLNSNGIAETKVQYVIVCRSDVSPAYMKLIIHEDTVKYSLRGSMWLKYGPDFKFEITENDANLEKLPKPKDGAEEMMRSFGRYENEKDFAAAPPEFLTYARKEWLKYVKEKMGE
jgi:hypothetical protein